LQPKFFNFNLIIITFGIFLFSNPAHALRFKPDFIYGGMFGYGGSGIEKTVIVENSNFDLSRAETPGMFGVSIETFIAPKYSLALGHRRGFRLGPFSSGVSFTGFTLRRYFYNSPPIIPHSKLGSSITMQTWAPFIGLGTGLAVAKTERETDVIPNVTSSQIYFGIHIGFDYQISPNLILRPEIFTSSSVIDVSDTPATLEEFGVVCGFHFRL
jgi:hypothetical protein